MAFDLRRILFWSATAMFLGACKPVSVQDYAKMEAQDCVDHKGYGDWVGSSGLTLEKFCEGVGDLKALEEDKKEHPENY